MAKVVLAYSGGLDTSVAISWLREQHQVDVVAVTLDLGQGGELNQIRERALAAGAIRCHVLDVREEFARDYVLPALQADALYEDRYPLATALGRPLIAKKLIDVSQMENASAIAHGCTGKSNDQVRIEVSARALDPNITVMAPAGEWEMSRPQEVEYARARRIAVPIAASRPYTTDENLWGRSIACGALEDPWQEPSNDVYAITKAPADAPAAAAYVEIEWQRGVPTAINGVEMPLVELIDSLKLIGGVHAVGRVDHSREIYEAPAAILLHTAHRELEGIAIPKDLQRLKQRLSQEYANVVYNGLWFSPTRLAIDAFVQTIQPRVTGTIRMKLYKGDCRVVGRKSPFALSDQALATYDDGDAIDHSAAEGLFNVGGLPVETAAKSARRGAAKSAKAAKPSAAPASK